MDNLEIIDALGDFNLVFTEYIELIRGTTEDKIGLIGIMLIDQMDNIIKTIQYKEHH